MEVTLYLDKGDALREEGFFESKVADLEKKLKALNFEMPSWQSQMKSCVRG